MFALLHSLAMCFVDSFKLQRRLEVENLFLRHQLSIALRRADWPVCCSDSDLWTIVCASGAGHGRRQLLWFEVTRHPTAEWLARQITEAFPWASAPTYLVRDNDRAYGHAFRSRLRAMGIRDRPISPGSPWQNPYVERLIGTVRRECLDRVLIFGEAHLRQILSSYANYYNEVRTHLSLGKDAPLGRAVQQTGVVVAIPILSGLHHHYVRI
jgi:transposase InsO family protein